MVIKDLKLVLLSSEPSTEIERSLYERAYQAWQGIWQKTFQELEGRQTIFSDDFLKQDEIAVLMYKNEVIGTSCFKWADLRLRAHQNNSYFQPWPQSILDSLIKDGCWNVLVGSYFSIDPVWRKQATTLPLKDIFFGLVVERFINSNTSVMVGTMRNDKGMENVAYRFGAKPLASNVDFHNVKVDLVVFLGDKIQTSPLPEVEFAIKYLWKNREEYGTSSYEKKSA